MKVKSFPKSPNIYPILSLIPNFLSIQFSPSVVKRFHSDESTYYTLKRKESVFIFTFQSIICFSPNNSLSHKTYLYIY